MRIFDECTGRGDGNGMLARPSFTASLCCLALLPCLTTHAAEVTIDCSKPIGRIRPLHGGNDGPLQGGGLTDLTAYHRELAIPHTRLHDCHWPIPSGKLVPMNLQNAPVDVACYFSANTQGFGLFTTHGAPRKVFQACKAFRMLLDTPIRLETRSSSASLTGCAGRNDANSEIGILVSNLDPADNTIHLTVSNLPWPGGAQYRIFIIDQTHDLQLIAEGGMEEAAPDPSIAGRVPD